MTTRNWLLLLTLSMPWGASFLFVEIALQDLGPLSVVWGRVTLGALVLAAVLAVTGGFPRGARVWAALAVMGLLNNALPFTLFSLAQGQITGSLAAILNATTPLFTVVVAHLAGAERGGAARLAAMALGFCGVVVMLSGPQAMGAVPAKMACLAAAVSYALAGVWGRRFREMGVSPLATAFGQVACAAVLVTPVWLATDTPWAMALPSMSAVGAVAGLAVLSTALAYLIYFRLLASAGATNLSLVTFLIPVSATALGVGVLEEVLLTRHLLGFALIISGLAMMDGRIGRAMALARK